MVVVYCVGFFFLFLEGRVGLFVFLKKVYISTLSEVQFFRCSLPEGKGLIWVKWMEKLRLLPKL